MAFKKSMRDTGAIQRNVILTAMGPYKNNNTENI